MAGKVTLKDIANAVGLSPTSVSLVLNDRPNKLSQESRRRIHEAACSMGYLPNQIARSLVTRRSNTFGLVLPNIKSRFFSSLAHDLEVRCRERGYLLLISNSDDNPDNDAQLVRTLAHHGVDGLFVVVADEFSPSPELVEALDRCPVPYVMIDRYLDALASDVVRYNNREGGLMACRHLLSAGHRRIACLVNRESRTGQERLEGYKAALREAGVAFDPSLVFHTRYQIADAYEAAAPMLATGVTAVFASSDNIALGVLKLLHEAGVSVPGDLSIVSYDNSAADTLFEPALTAIEQDSGLLAENALKLMFDRMDAEDRSKGGADEDAPHFVELFPRLVVKESVRRI